MQLTYPWAGRNLRCGREEDAPRGYGQTHAISKGRSVMRRFISRLALSLVAIAIVGCGAKPWIEPRDATDTPEYNYNLGMKALEEGDDTRAMASFERAMGLDPKYAPAYEGVGLTHLHRGSYEEAEKSLKEALKKDKKYARAHVGLGRVDLAQGKTKDARKDFDDAMELTPSDPDPYYYTGQSYMSEQNFDRAEHWFRQTLDRDRTYLDADAAWAKADRIKRAQPGTELGVKISLMDEISRADLSALISEELDLDSLLRGRMPKQEGSAPDSIMNVPDLMDISDHWAESHIRDMTRYGVLGQFPDHRFRPDDALRRADLATAVENILTRATGEDELRTKFLGSPSPFPDVKKSNYAYNAIVLASTRGILTADVADGMFHPDAPVAGADALLALRQLVGLLQ